MCEYFGPQSSIRIYVYDGDNKNRGKIQFQKAVIMVAVRKIIYDFERESISLPAIEGGMSSSSEKLPLTFTFQTFMPGVPYIFYFFRL